MNKATTIKKTISAVLSAVTLSACVVLPSPINQNIGKSSFINTIVADAAVNTTYDNFIAKGVVNVNLTKMYMFDPIRNKFVSYEDAMGISSNVKKGTAVGIIGKKGNYYLVSKAEKGMWIKKNDISLLQSVQKATETTSKSNSNIKSYKVVGPVTFSVAATYFPEIGPLSTGTYRDVRGGSNNGDPDEHNFSITYNLNYNTVLELDDKGICIRYHGNQKFYSLHGEVSPVGHNFKDTIGKGLKEIQ